MTVLTDIVIPISAFGGISAVIWGASKIVEGSKIADKVQSEKIDRHDDVCGQERASNRTAISALTERVGKLEVGKRDK